LAIIVLCENRRAFEYEIKVSNAFRRGRKTISLMRWKTVNGIKPGRRSQSRMWMWMSMWMWMKICVLRMCRLWKSRRCRWANMS